MANVTVQKVRTSQLSYTEEEWTTDNPILLKGEIGVINDTDMYVVGDGTNEFVNLTQHRMDGVNVEVVDECLIFS